jgi:hypothetical protein
MLLHQLSDLNQVGVRTDIGNFVRHNLLDPQYIIPSFFPYYLLVEESNTGNSLLVTGHFYTEENHLRVSNLRVSSPCMMAVTWFFLFVENKRRHLFT